MENEEFLNYVKRAFDLKNQKNYKHAVEMFYKALSLEPNNYEILYQLGEIYFLMGNYSRAIQYPEQILSENEYDINALNLINKIYLAQNNIRAVRQTAEKLFQLNPDDHNLTNLVKIYADIDILSELEPYKEKILKNQYCLYEYAKYHQKICDFDNAIKYINLALDINKSNENYLILKGKILYDMGKLSDAKEIFNNYDYNTSNPEILNYKGLFELDDKNYIEAVKYFSKAISIDGKNPKYYYNLGNAYFLNGWSNEAIAAYKKAIIFSPDNLDYRYSLAYLYISNLDFVNAKNEVKFILSQNPKHPGANVIKGLLLLNKEDFLGAEKAVELNITNGFDDDYTLSSLVSIKKELKKYNQAEKYLQVIIERNPNNLGYMCDLCDLYMRKKQYKKAINMADSVTKINPNYIEGYILGGQSALAMENFNQAKYYAQNLLSIDINCATGYYILGIVRKAQGDYAEAIECLKRAILRDVNNAKYYAELALIYAILQDNKTAFDYIKEAQSIDNSEEYKILYKKFATLTRK